MRTAIFGVGSLGTITGALMSKNGVDVTLIDSYKAHVDELNKNGASIVGKMELSNVPVHAILPEEMEGIYDVIFLMTKQTVNDIVLPLIVEHMNENSVLCTLQNGAPEDFVAKYVGYERTIGGVVGWGAEFIKPGVSSLSSDPYRMVFEIGELDGSITPRIQEIAGILGKACTCNIITNLIGVRWSKLITNSTMSGLSAALGITYGDIIHNDETVKVAAFQTNELIRVANARNIRLETLFEGYDFYDLLFDDKAGLERAIKWLKEYYEPDAPLIASMLRDMRNGVKCEIEQICGLVAMWGDKLGIDTPLNDKCIEIVKEFEAGIRPMPTIENVSEFVLPCI